MTCHQLKNLSFSIRLVMSAHACRHRVTKSGSCWKACTWHDLGFALSFPLSLSLSLSLSPSLPPSLSVCLSLFPSLSFSLSLSLSLGVSVSLFLCLCLLCLQAQYSIVFLFTPMLLSSQETRLGAVVCIIMLTRYTCEGLLLSAYQCLHSQSGSVKKKR